MFLNLRHIGQIALPVSDVDRAEAFYADVLGLPKLYRFGDLTFFDCAGVRLLLEKARGEFAAQGTIYFRCADIALAVAELTKRGVTFTGRRIALPRWTITISGWRSSPIPDGHTLALMHEAPKGYELPRRRAGKAKRVPAAQARLSRTAEAWYSLAMTKEVSAGTYPATREELAKIDEALAAVRRGEIASADEVEAVFAKAL